ncbi:MAG: alanyl-tRNA editing protein [Candidatus Diapherotrites archaeon]|nr:alanyl-tRNA editing protein [Candidatus Diapherotrites archaeon]
MTEELYLLDHYLKEFDAKVVEVGDDYVVLDRTAFFPRASGLEGDTGKIATETGEYRVIGGKRAGGKVIHFLETTDGLRPGMDVHGIIDWENRYRQMRLHTASHIVASLFYQKYGAEITGGHITAEKARDMLNVDQLTPEMVNDVFSKANEIAQKAIPVNVYWLPREKALKIPGIVKLAARMPPSIERWRIVEIPGVDIQADGGPHVANTKEIGEIIFLKKENKGKGKKTIHFTVQP